ncbi:MAG: methionyl-tRNA formyltransferase [Halanaerobiales bacterium]|jgi:methionyl-tRNA formyltransferase|nr:methionyl-tRNA formyltransferase [Bacillota bacterium]
MRIVFMGTPDFSVPSLEKLYTSSEIEIKLVITQPDKPRGRGQKLAATPIKKRALELGLETLETANVNQKDIVEKIRGLSPDIIVVVAFGQKLSQEILDIPPYGCVNLHASLLPEYRGASPIHRAIIDGKKVTGVTTMYMAEGWDTGDMIYKEEVKIEETDTMGILHDKLASIGAELLLKTLLAIERGLAPREEQDHSKASYTGKIDKNTGAIDWQKSSLTIYNLVRGVNPWPGAYTHYKGETIKIWQTRLVESSSLNEGEVVPGTIVRADTQEGLVVRTGDGFLEIVELQIPGRKKMLARELLNGYTINIGESFELKL